jgi:hypothetical protein
MNNRILLGSLFIIIVISVLYSYDKQKYNNIIDTNKDIVSSVDTDNILENFQNNWDPLNPPTGNNNLYIAMIADDNLDIYYDKGSKSGLASYSHPNVKFVGSATCCNKLFKFVVNDFKAGDRLILYLKNTGHWEGFFAGHIYWKGKFFPTNSTNFKISSVETKTSLGVGNPGGKYIAAGRREGCFNDIKPGSTNRKLPKLLGTNQSNEECRDLALQGKYKYFGLQFGGECWAGNDYNLAISSGKIPDTNCNMRSKKSEAMRVTQDAGNANVNDIYNTTLPPNIRDLGRSGFSGLHPSSRKICAEIGASINSYQGPNHWYEFEFKPVDVVEPELNVLSVFNLCEPKLENTNNQTSNPLCNVNLTKDDLKALTYLVVNTPEDFVTKSIPMSDFSKGQKSTFGYSTVNDSTTFSISLWIKIKETRNYWRSILRIGEENDQSRLPGIWIIPNQTGVHFRVSTKNAWNDGTDLPSGLFSLNKWYNLVFTVSNNKLQIFYNGDYLKDNLVRFSSKVLQYNPNTMKLYLNNYGNADDGTVEISKLRVYPIELSADFVKNVVLSEVPNDNKNYYDCMTTNKTQPINLAHLKCMNLIFSDLENFSNPDFIENFVAADNIQKKKNGRLLQLKDNSNYYNTDIDPALRPPSFKIRDNVVYLSGLLRRPSNGIIIELPEEIRPDKRLSFVVGHTIPSRLDIEPNGNVNLYGSNDGYLSLDSVHYNISSQGTLLDYSMPKKTYFVRITARPGQVINLAEIVVKDGTINVSNGKRTRQSSDYGAGQGDSDRAVDGVTDGNWSSQTVTHTIKASSDYIEIDLEGGFFVSSVEVYNRTDCCKDRIAGSIIELLDVNRNRIQSMVWPLNENNLNYKQFSFNVDRGTKISTNWTNFTDVNKDANHRNGSYRVVGNVVYLMGVVLYRTGNVKPNTIIGRVGNDAIPDKLRICNALVNEQNCRIDIDTDGYIILRSFDVTKTVWNWISLESISYIIKTPNNMSINSPFSSFVDNQPTPIYILDKYNTFENKPIAPTRNSPFEVNGVSMMGNMSISMWLYTRNNGRQNPISKGYASEGTITIEPNGTLSYYYGIDGNNPNGGPYQGINSIKGITYDEWNHVCIVRDFTTSNLFWYINGNLVNKEKTQYTYASQSKLKLLIGRGYVNNYVGKIRDLRIFSSAISEVNINNIINKNNSNLYAKPFYTKNNNVIHFGGVISIPRNITSGSIITLDEKGGYRPNKILVFIANQNGKLAKLSLLEDGNLRLEYCDPSIGFLSLDGITYNSNKY